MGDNNISIVRQLAPTRITLEEWLSFVSTSTVVRIAPPEIGINPFTKEQIDFKPIPGAAHFDAPGGQCTILYKNGALRIFDAGEDAMPILAEIAAALGAAVVTDPYDLSRFVSAQERHYARALSEIRNGQKQSHWMWYVFPQFAGLGSSATSNRYSIKSIAEAKAYLAHSILGPRLLECAEAVLAVDGRSALDIFDSPDDMKLRSCVTLFARISPAGSVFDRVLEKYFQGEPDGRTLRLLNTHAQEEMK